MDTSLLSALRFVEWRKNKRKEHKPEHGELNLPKVLSYRQVLFELSITTTCDRNSILVDIPSHKTREALDFVASQYKAKLAFIDRVPLVRSPRSILFFIKNFEWRRAKALYPLLSRRYSDYVLRSCLDFWVLTLSYERCFRKYPPAAVVVVSDISTNRLAMAFAANRCGVPVIYYQFSPQHKFRPPFRPDTAICMNEAMAKLVRETWPDARIIKRDIFSKSPFRYPEYRSINNAIGIALNKAINLDEVNSFVKILKSRFPGYRIILRPHPLVRENIFSQVQCEISSSEKDIYSFCEEVDFCITGNTSATHKILFNGVPCVYRHGMDSGEYDAYGYVKDGLIADEKEISLLINKITKFYKSENTKNNINNYIKENIK